MVAEVAPNRVDDLSVVIAGGGTGGHLFPAIAVVRELRERVRSSRVVFFSSARRVDQHILGDIGADIVAQTLRPLSRYPWHWPGIWMSLRNAGAECRRRFGSAQPDVVIGSGGLSSFPAVLEAARAGIPTVLLNPDARPGKANRLLARRANLIVVQWEAARSYFRSSAPVAVLGCAVRAEFRQGDRVSAARAFELDPARRTLLVTGASQGARTINRAIMANLDLFERSGLGWQVLHLTGEADRDEVQAGYASRSVVARVLPFTDRMGAAMQLADLLVSRAGASTLAEITAVGRASILMPYPFDRGQHQRANAECLEREGAAVIVDDAGDGSRNAAPLRSALESLMRDDARRAAMAEAARRIGRPDAAARIADRVLELVHSHRALQSA